MPFVPAENPKCPKCSKSVYAAEERVAGGKKFHKQCFKCGLCNKFLDSTNCAEHGDELYCKACHGRKYGPKGYGFGGGAGALSMDSGAQFGNTETADETPKAPAKPMSKAPDGEGCPRCGGNVYAAEQMLAKGRSWHRECYKCNDCNKRLDSVNTCEAPDGEIYCKVCYAKRFGPKGYGSGLSSDVCSNGQPDVSKIRPIHLDTSLIKAAEGQQGCPRCGGAVYAAEQMLARGSVWHKGCFNCKECRRVLDSIIACDGPDHDVYCRLCYAKKYGPKGYGFGGGSAFLQSDSLPNGLEMDQSLKATLMPSTTSIKAAEGEGCPRCGGAVYAAEQQLAKGTMWHKRCFSCADCKRPLDSMLACDGPNKEIYCKACYGRRWGPKGFGYGHTPTLVSVGGDTETPLESKPVNKAAEGEGCARCGFAVYAAEQMISKNKIWHKRCFSCNECRRSLDSTSMNDAPTGEIYCLGCYRKKYGPHGVGYGMGAGALSMA